MFWVPVLSTEATSYGSTCPDKLTLSSAIQKVLTVPASISRLT